MGARIKKVCSTCGSTNVLADAWAEWCEIEQKWELQNVFDAAHCEDCDGETSIDDEELTTDNIGPSTTNASLAEELDLLIAATIGGKPVTARMLNALEEAAERVRETIDED